MKKVYFIIILIAPLVIACSPSQEETQATAQASIAQTQIAMPTSTPTVIPFSSLNLESILIVEGDLPAGYSGGRYLTDPGVKPTNKKPPDYFIGRTLERNNHTSGVTGIIVYDDSATVKDLYQVSVQNALGKDYSKIDVGDMGVINSQHGPLDTVVIVFVRCNAVAVIQLVGTSDITALKTYATRLDHRIQPFVCR